MNHAEELLEKTKTLRVAVVHDWMFVRRGGEKVLEKILDLFPHADVYCLFGNPKTALRNKEHHRYFKSYLARIPLIQRIYKLLLPFFPSVIESFDLTRYDVIVSSSHCVAKGIIPSPAAVHISYIHSPMRYVWDQEHRYFTRRPSLFRPFEILRRVFLSRLRIWDVTSAQRSDVLIANSHFVKRRCELYYGRTSHVVYPPVEIERFLPIENTSTQKKVLLFGVWVPYKGMGDALELLLKNDFQVVAAGDGDEIETLLQRYRNNKKVRFHIRPSDRDVQSIFAESHVLVFPAIEDFGIVVVEALAAGLLVVCPRAGATVETVKDGVTGFHFQLGNEADMLEKLRGALATEMTPELRERLQDAAKAYSAQAFKENFAGHVLRILSEKRETL